MGWFMIDEPGNGSGPCAPTCEHEDCAENRALVARPCVLCGKPIGYSAKLYIDDDGAKHATCVWSRRSPCERAP